MKILKKIVFILTITLFTSIFNNSAIAETDCSNPKGFHQKMMCKYKGQSSDSNTVDSNKPKKKGWLHKIRTFGGSTV